MFSKALKFVTLESTQPVTSKGEGEEVFEDVLEAQLHHDAHPDGGLGCSDLLLLERQRGAILEVMKTLGKNLITGNFDLLKISLPIKLFEPRSYLEKLADPWVYSRFLLLAAEAGRNNNPVLRMQYVITYFIAGFHRVFLKWAKPANPILGETWQASLPDGTSIFLEQISHHPPISAFQMFAKNKEYYFHGLSQPVVGYKANAIKASAKGYRRIEFAHGGAIEMTFPAYYIKGLVYAGAPRSELGGTAEFIDRANGLMAVIHFQKVENLPGSGGGNGNKNHALLSRNDAVSGTIYRTRVHHHDDDEDSTNNLSTPPGSSTTEKSFSVGDTKRSNDQKKGEKTLSSSIFRSKSSIINTASGGNSVGLGGNGGGGGGGSRFGLIGKSFSNFRRTTSNVGFGFNSDASGNQVTGEVRIPVAHCTGNWLAYIDWDGERFWTLNEEESSDWIPDPHPLPSDARFREDLTLLLTEDVAAAQVAKEALENRQRADAKLRKV